MAIAYLIPSLNAGGAEHQTISHVNYLYQAGWNVHLIVISTRVALLDKLGIPEQNIHLLNYSSYHTLHGKTILQSLHGLSVFDNVTTLESYGLAPLERIDHLERRNNESLEDWRDRLFAYQNIPTVQASLSGIKQSFVESINPFLNHEIVLLTRRFSENQRTGKKLFKYALKEHLLVLPVANQNVIGHKSRILGLQGAKEYIMDHLLSHSTRTILGNKLPDFLVENTSFEEKYKKKSFKNNLRKILPNSIIKSYRESLKSERIDLFKIVFRSLMINDVIKKLS